MKLKVLMVNGFHYPRGGAERCYLDLSALLQGYGHEVVPFSMDHEGNLPSEYSDYFLSHTDFPRLLEEKNGWRSKLQVFERVVYSREAKQKIEALIENTQPDIAHIHNIAHYISPSILPAIKRAGIPIVMTLHDYKLLCPNTHFLSRGEVCERCKVHRYYNVILRRCKRDSLAASTLAGVEHYLHKISQIYERNVDVFISPSAYLGAKLREYGIDNDIEELPNFLNLDNFGAHYKSDGYALYFGRLSPEKGLGTLLHALRSLNGLPMYIAGSGSAEGALRRTAEENDLSNVKFLGHLSSDELLPLIQKATVTVLPSESYENYPMTILESMACGTSVIGSDIGGIPGLIRDGWNGLLFRPGDARQLAEKIEYVFENPDETLRMAQNGRKQVERINNPENHYQQTHEIYSRLLNGRVSGHP
jgi:glycosyltransferase involved in cell wall biosynthesis